MVACGIFAPGVVALAHKNRLPASGSEASNGLTEAAGVMVRVGRLHDAAWLELHIQRDGRVWYGDRLSFDPVSEELEVLRRTSGCWKAKHASDRLSREVRLPQLRQDPLDVLCSLRFHYDVEFGFARGQLVE